MRLGDRAAVTDPGRKRRRNEDAYIVEPPLFAVADGMGGAQAGEVASRLATAAFREFHDADDLDGEGRLRATIQEANRRIFERARTDAEASGMGTTITAALVGGDRIAIGHVGDSRAYRIREGQLEQLTQDHSLVADLMRSGRLTAEEAETHPQRSVITRALGTDSEVDVDTFTVEALSGDVYLLCSDGLTTMVGDEKILRTVRESKELERAGKALVKEANRRGGDDNVTVVLFSVEEGETLDDTLVAGNGHAEDENLEDTLTGLEAPTLRQPGGTTIVRAQEPDQDEVGKAEPAPAGPRRRWRRGLLWALVVIAVVAILVAAAFWGLSRAYFVGAEEDGHVAVYQGLPWDLGKGVDLYRARYVSQLSAVQLGPAERERLFDHSLVSYGEARDRLAGFEEEGVP